MGWERRNQSGRKYYTRSRRVGGRVKREYVGTGEIAEVAEALDSIQRERRDAKNAVRREFRPTVQGLDTAVAAYCRGVDAVVSASAEASGYRQHKRGEWRRKRRPNNSNQNADK